MYKSWFVHLNNSRNWLGLSKLSVISIDNTAHLLKLIFSVIKKKKNLAHTFQNNCFSARLIDLFGNISTFHVRLLSHERVLLQLARAQFCVTARDS